ncbi:MAG: helix-turn-helix domain-containing protein [Spirochaetia bacterium]|nr:helix-turn-helix domain-containing protein [Spirochaetia bacterium]
MLESADVSACNAGRTNVLSSIVRSKLPVASSGRIVNETATLLKTERNRSILSIAYAAGFNSKSSFHKVFLARFGCSPTEFRDRQAR